MGNKIYNLIVKEKESFILPSRVKTRLKFFSAGILILVFHLSLFSVLFAKTQGNLKIGYDTSGNFESSQSLYLEDYYYYYYLSGETKSDVSDAFSVGLELYDLYKNGVGFGFGAIYQSPRKIIELDADFSLVPIYFLLRLYPAEGFYLIGHGGYNLINADFYDTEGGIYYGAGFGMENENIGIELLYSVNNGFLSR